MGRRDRERIGAGLEELLRFSLGGLPAAPGPRVEELPVEALRPRPGQPRRRLEGLEALAESIRRQGVLQPLLVRPLGEGYEILAGERRYRAALLLGLERLPCRILELSDREAQAVALAENLQREDLNPYEETLGVLDLLALNLDRSREEVVALLQRMRNAKRGRVTHNVMGNPEAERVEEVFRALGRFTWESFVQNRLPLLRLPEEVRGALERGEIPYTAALVLKGVKDPGLRRTLLEEARQGLSLAELKARVRGLSSRQSPRTPPLEEVLERLKGVRLEELPPAKRARVERLLVRLAEALEGA